MIRIGKKPFIANVEDRWGQVLPELMVYNSAYGYVTKEFWKQLKDFENYNQKKDTPDFKVLTGLIHKSGHHALWEFNLLVKPDGEEWIRYFACLGEPSFKRWTFIDDIRVAFLEWKVARHNKRLHD